MRYHLIGDQGISMSGIKKYLESLGCIVSGSDLKSGGHKADNISRDIDVVVRSSAINPGSEGWVEVEAAKKKSIPVIKRSELLGELTKDKKLIAISGMHGKTTITTMAGLTLIEAGFDPTVIVGERVAEFNDEVLSIGKSDWFVMEACEYDRSFLDFNPYILILTNIEEEHLDTYPGGLKEIKEAFSQYITRVKPDGVIIACADDENVMEVIKNTDVKARIIYYGLNAEKYNKLDFKIKLPGNHNRLNAMAILALADLLEININVVQKVLEKFGGAKRRFEYKGSCHGCDVIDDYGHHPTEIKATIAALAEKYSDQKKYVIFWPHQYKRVQSLLKEFASAFDFADEVILKPIYFVPGRDEKLDVESNDLAVLIKERGKAAKVMSSDEDIVEYLRRNINDKSVVLTIGIPPVYKIAEKLISS